MKSINEKAEELTEKRVELSREESITYFQGIEAGANYVLECIEDIIANNEDNTLNMARCLVDCIEQLKK